MQAELLTSREDTDVTRDEIRALLQTNNYAVEEALLRLHARQTPSEQARQATTDDNGVGFNAFDAQILSSFAQQIAVNRGGYPRGRRLSEKQMTIARKKVLRYLGQIYQMALDKAGQVLS